MVSFDKLKALGNDLLEKAGDLAGKAKDKAGPLAEQAKEKAGPLADKAKDAAAKGADLAADRIDKATGGKYHDKIDAVQDKVEGALGQKSATDDIQDAADKAREAVEDIKKPDPTTNPDTAV